MIPGKLDEGTRFTDSPSLAVADAVLGALRSNEHALSPWLEVAALSTLAWQSIPQQHEQLARLRATAEAEAAARAMPTTRRPIFAEDLDRVG